MKTLNNFMEIKEFLQKGGRIIYPYKRHLLSWYGEISMSIIEDHYTKKQNVVLQVPIWEEMPIEQLDEAIERFFRVALSKDNIHHVQQELTKKFDYDIEVDAEIMGEEMKKLGYREDQYKHVDEEENEISELNKDFLSDNDE